MRLAFVAANTEAAERARRRLTARSPSVSPQEADVIVALGGDGFMLETLHRFIARAVPIFGINCGTVGFLMNPDSEGDLAARIATGVEQRIHPLRMRAATVDGQVIEGLAINEVSLLRESRQSAKIEITVDGIVRLEELNGDGVLLATPAGSTAYNLSVQGPILPIGANLLALTPISPFRPRRWRGAVLPHTAEVSFRIIDAEKRPVSATADFTEVRDVARVSVIEDRSVTLRLLFDSGHDLEERIRKEQFAP